MKVRWTGAAERDRYAIWEYIVAEDPLAALQIDDLFSATAGKLADFPHLGKTGSIAGTRVLLPHESYRLVYEVEAETVWILALVHTARQWPPVVED